MPRTNLSCTFTYHVLYLVNDLHQKKKKKMFIRRQFVQDTLAGIKTLTGDGDVSVRFSIISDVHRFLWTGDKALGTTLPPHTR